MDVLFACLGLPNVNNKTKTKTKLKTQSQTLFGS